MMISRRVWSCHPGAILINREIQNGRHQAFIKNDIYLKVIELETSYWCQTIYFWYQGIIWNCAYCVTLLENPIWLPNMWNNYFVFPSAVKYVSKWMILMLNWHKYICISLITCRKKTNTVWHLFIIMKTSNYINYIYSYTNYIYYWYKLVIIWSWKILHTIPSLNPTLWMYQNTNIRHHHLFNDSIL